MNSFEIKRAIRVERLQVRSVRLAAEAEVAEGSARRIADVIPMGQPILVGHHSEKRHRRDVERIRRGFDKAHELRKEAVACARRAASAAENDAVSSDDPAAIDKLRVKLFEAERQHAVLLMVNNRLRRGATPAEVAPLLDFWTDPARRIEIYRSMGQKTLPTTNSGAEVRRLKARILELEGRATAPAKEPVVGVGWRIDDEDNRVRIFFDGKPSEAVRAELKSHGFKWAPSVGAWQRMTSPNAWYWATALMTSASATAPHARDEDCTIGEDGCCTTCGVFHGDACACGGRGFHRAGCVRSNGGA